MPLSAQVLLANLNISDYMKFDIFYYYWLKLKLKLSVPCAHWIKKLFSQLVQYTQVQDHTNNLSRQNKRCSILSVALPLSCSDVMLCDMLSNVLHSWRLSSYTVPVRSVLCLYEKRKLELMYVLPDAFHRKKGWVIIIIIIKIQSETINIHVDTH